MTDVFTRAPHRPTGSQAEYAPHAALLIDFDNVTMGIRSNLGQELRKLLDSDIIGGKVTVQRAYADWRRYPQYIVPLSEASIDLIFAPAYGSSKKNATDIRLAIDALEIVFTRPEIGTFILLSGDSDFSTMVMKLKEYGKYVIGVGMQESSSDLLVQNCDEYYSYTSLAGLQSAADLNTERYDPWELAGQAIERMVTRKDVMRSDRFKQVMLELDSSFSEKALGFSKFNRFLTEAASRGIIDLHKAANGQYEVGPGPGASDYAHRAEKGRAEAKSAGPSKISSGGTSRDSERRASGGRSTSRRGRGRSKASEKPAPTFRPEETPQVDEDRLRQAYALLQKVVEARTASGEAVRDSEVKRKMLAIEPSFDEGALGFAKFSRFLRQAHDEEIINLERNDGGNLLITPVTASPAPSRSRDRSPKAPEADAVVVERTAAEVPAAEEPAAEAPAAESSQARPRRGFGRFRRGSRKDEATVAESKPDTSVASKPVVETPEPVADETPEPAVAETPEPAVAEMREPATPAADTGDFDVDAAVERMSRNYPGVGRRTAQLLVEEFGADVFNTIDRSPDKVKTVLPGHRAQAVLDGRKAERDGGGSAKQTPSDRKPARPRSRSSSKSRRDGAPTSEAKPEPTSKAKVEARTEPEVEAQIEPEAAPAPEAAPESAPEADVAQPGEPTRSRLARRSGGRRR